MSNDDESYYAPVDPPAVAHTPTIDSNATYSEVCRSDLKLIAQAIEGLENAWKEARTVEKVCKLISATETLIAARRDALRMEYGATKNPFNNSPYDSDDDEDGFPVPHPSTSLVSN